MQTTFLASTFFVLPLKAFIDILYAWEYHYNYFSKCCQTVLESKRNRSDTINIHHRKKEKACPKKRETQIHLLSITISSSANCSKIFICKAEERSDTKQRLNGRAQWLNETRLDEKSIKFSAFSRSKGMKGRSRDGRWRPRFLRIAASDAIMQPGRLRGSIRAYISYCA